MKKIAVASSGDLPESKISDLAARAPYILIFGEGLSLLEVVSNPFAVGGGGAGFSVAKILSDKGVTDFVCTRAGPNLERALNERGISLHIVNLGIDSKSAAESVAR